MNNKKMSVKNEQSYVTDYFENCYTIPCSTRMLLWSSDIKQNISGSFTLHFDQLCERAGIFVNGQLIVSKPQFLDTIDPFFSYTFQNLETLEIDCNPGPNAQACKVTLCMTLHYVCC